MMNSQKDMPVIVGNFFIDSLNKYLKNLSQEEFETLDKPYRMCTLLELSF